MMRALLVVALGLSACSSTHDLAKGPSMMGGGLFSEELQPGLHYVVSKSHVAPWTNHESVAQVWRDRAGQLCGKGGYRELQVVELVEEELAPMRVFVLSLPYLATIRKGYVLCAGSPLSEEAALRYLDLRR
ncbi:hypothetical protein [Aromatoleum diolicum]|uniref:Lipoprotein n=1 Tax=Aromatoleum diolicum TaxID=75796 RepID=A0ABX1QHL9_9RHOO|nr:hypothetical protein [Aromatoleum diolicum]NMG76966.1 hypothetical protein [Aromatoleum diolicum]